MQKIKTSTYQNSIVHKNHDLDLNVSVSKEKENLEVIDIIIKAE